MSDAYLAETVDRVLGAVARDEREVAELLAEVERRKLRPGPKEWRLALSFIVPGVPVPWARARTGKGRHFIAPEVERHARTIAGAATLACNRARFRCLPLRTPVRMVFAFYLPIPAGFSKRRREQAEAGAILPAVKPDQDNLAKLVLDATEGILFASDSQVVSSDCDKIYSTVPETFVQVFV